MSKEEARWQMEQWRSGDEIHLTLWKASNKYYFKEWYKKNKLAVKDAGLKQKYGLTLKEYNKMYQDQKGRCANRLCDLEFDSTVRNLRPHVDHDHKTKKVRGLLCQGCNTGLGHFKDNIAILSGAIEYLRQANLPTSQ